MKRILCVLAIILPIFCCACDPTWESTYVGYRGVKVWRLKVDGGWMVFLEADSNSSVVFKRDENHSWVLP